jgi:ubiquinone/menaquinone biosynthesis C-methylase UbiE
MYKDRIVELRRVRAGDLAPAPLNWRKHPKAQQDAMKGILDEIGYADAVLARETPRGLELIDGHLRTSLDDEQVLPVLVLDLNDEEATKMLLTLDPLAAMAETDTDALAALLADVTFSDEAITEMLDGIQTAGNSVLDDLIADRVGQTWAPDIKYANGEPLHETVGYDLMSVWPKTGSEETRAYPFFSSLPRNPDISPGGFKANYSRSPALEMERIIQTYMRPGDRFLEVCAGWFTFSLSAAVWGYEGEGVDIWDTSLDFGRRQLKHVNQSIEGAYKVVRGDALALPYDADSFDFVYCNPPFFQLEKYSDLPNDLANRRTLEEWLSDSGRMMAEMLRVAKPGALVVTVMADYREKGILVPLHIRWIEEGLMQGLELHDIAIQSLRAQAVRMWRSQYNNKHTVKAHEYVVVFRKPGHGVTVDVTDDDTEVIA